MTDSTIKIPANHSEALEAIAALDAAKWGESEREASREMNEGKSYGLLLNALAHRPEYDFGDAVPHLVDAARSALTPADRRALREGG